MKISVIMSVYNDARYLKESVESILNQSYENFEFIITNDCSTDESKEIILDYMKKDERISFIDNETNMGLTKNLNNMIKRSRGELIARMDSDDISNSDRFLSQMKLFESFPDIDFVFTNALIIDENSEIVCNSWRPNETKEIIRLMPFYSYIIHPSVMVRKKAFEKVGLYNENYKTGQDHELWLRMIEKDINFSYLNQNLLKYRINPQSVRRKADENYYYKLAKTCLAYNQKRKALSYFKKLDKKQKIELCTRVLIPFSIYREMIYRQNKMSRKIR